MVLSRPGRFVCIQDSVPIQRFISSSPPISHGHFKSKRTPAEIGTEITYRRQQVLMGSFVVYAPRSGKPIAMNSRLDGSAKEVGDPIMLA